MALASLVVTLVSLLLLDFLRLRAADARCAANARVTLGTKYFNASNLLTKPL
jgi:hypothetical protein